MCQGEQTRTADPEFTLRGGDDAIYCRTGTLPCPGCKLRSDDRPYARPPACPPGVLADDSRPAGRPGGPARHRRRPDSAVLMAPRLRYADRPERLPQALFPFAGE